MTTHQELRNAVAGVCAVLLGAAALVATSGLPTGRPAAADPGLLPRVVGVGLVCVGVLLVALAALRWRRSEGAPQVDEGLPVDLPVDVPGELLVGPAEEADLTQVAGFALVTLLYAVGAFRLGFTTSTALYIIAGALVLGRGRHARSLVVLVVFALAVALAYDVLFFTLLNVREPDTPLP
jgi:hypothetical protein